MPDNTTTLVGNLTADPEKRFTQNGTAVANMRVAVNRRVRTSEGDWEDRTDGFFNVVVWRELAANAAQSLSKGDRVLVTGRLTERSFEDRDGNTRYVTEVEADEVCPSLRWAIAQPAKVDRRRDDGQQPTQSQGEPQAEPAPTGASPADDDLPF